MRVYNHRKRILSLPECGWEPSGRTRRGLDTENDKDGESKMDGGISVQYRIALPTIITDSIADTRLSSPGELPVPRESFR